MEIEKIRVQSAVRMAFLSLGGVFVDFFLWNILTIYQMFL
jgi:hypothetical protein